MQAQVDAYRQDGVVDGLPTPPLTLVHLVTGGGDIDGFLHLGRAGAESFSTALARNELEAGRILDFGCGCGRVARFLTDLDLFGCDYNSALVRWCQHHLPGDFYTNALQPPLRYHDGFFDSCYAFSVFTHLTLPKQKQWRDELARVIHPGGCLVASFHGDSYLEGRMTVAERDAYTNGEIVVRHGEREGTNTCAAFHPPSAVALLFEPHFTVVDFVPEGARGNPDQDLFVLRRR
jgi:SAM-dependent methyltransferase